jgi:hypothetical protein
MLTEFFGSAPEDQEVGAVVRRAIDEMQAHGATAVDVAVPDLAAQLTASNLLTQELKFYLGAYLRTSSASVASVEELLASGLHLRQLQGILDIANAVPDDYLSGDEYKRRLAARVALGQAVTTMMDEHRLAAVVYPTTRRVAPVVGGNQIGSNAALAAQTGFPAITVPAGFTPGGFPVGIELLGRPFGEPTLIALAYSFEQSTNHRRPPSSTPPLGAKASPAASVQTSADTGAGSLRIEATATGAQAVPPSDVPFTAVAQISFNSQTRQLGYHVLPNGSLDQIAGVYLHRRANRQNGGVAYILAKSPAAPISGKVMLSEAEASDLKAGKFYVAVISRKSPRLSARANLVFPSA